MGERPTARFGGGDEPLGPSRLDMFPRRKAIRRGWRSARCDGIRALKALPKTDADGRLRSLERLRFVLRRIDRYAAVAIP